jgi:ribose/xylose/arabinose/galactoside ABC-type transport system permease subunit
MRPSYLGSNNILIILKSASITGLLGIGVGMLLISGQVDLATSSVSVISSVFVAMLLSAGLPWTLAVLITLIFGALSGLITSILVNKLNMMSFIATIGLSSIWQGLALVITRSNPIKFKNDAFLKIGSTAIGYDQEHKLIPLMFIILVVLIIVYGFILSQTKFGRSVYMCGGNRNAARLAGIKPKKIHTLLFVNCGAIASLAGVFIASNFRKGDPTARTEGLDAITAAVLGGILFTGGAGGTGGLLTGLMLLSFFNNGIIAVGLKNYWQIFARGALLILALLFDYYREKQRLKMLKASADEAASADATAVKA